MIDTAVAPECLSGVRVLDLSQFEAGPLLHRGPLRCSAPRS
jgi:hypothetical protein